jgi:hypothetical protein
MKLNWQTHAHGYVLRDGQSMIHAIIVKRKEGYYADLTRMVSVPSGPYKQQTKAAEFVARMLGHSGVEVGELPYRRGEATGIRVSNGQAIELHAA